MTHPSEWPTLCEEYPVVTYLQHSEWANNIYKPYFGGRCAIWPVGIDTHEWTPASGRKETDFLIYDKILWDRERRVPELLQPIQNELGRRGLTSVILRYGDYNPEQYKDALGRSRAMIFLCEHESQGLAYQEALASGVPILAWDQGWWLDPNRFQWGETDVPATSVPYFDERCGVRFKDFESFRVNLGEFMGKLNHGEFRPRNYILEHLTLERCAKRYCEILQESAAGMN
jgi:glycosyltransferase involved in cell wall biosynthesis